MYRLFVIIILSAATLGETAEKIEQGEAIYSSFSEYEVLDSFFRSLLNESKAGYTLYGDKPLFLDNYLSDQYELPGTTRHREAVEAELALQYLPSSNVDSASNYLLITSVGSDDNSSNEILLINRAKFLSVVQQNLILFRQAFGPRVTPEGLLERIQDEGVFGSGIFAGNHALIGICLGYGTNNSLMYQRGEELSRLVSSSLPKPPYQGEQPPVNQYQLIDSLSRLDVKPGFGYLSLAEEVQDMVDSMQDDTDRLQGTHAEICFSYQRGTEESNELLDAYIAAQKCVDELMASEEVVERCLSRLHLNELALGTDLPVVNPKDISQLPRLIASNIWEAYEIVSLLHTNDAGSFHFIKGVSDGLELDQDPEQLLITNPHFQELDSCRIQLAASPKAQQRALCARDYFEKLVCNEDLETIIPSLLYFRTLVQGSGDRISGQSDSVIAHYLIKNQTESVLCGSHHLADTPRLSLSRLIPGMAHGMQGMKVGETRQIYIHPNLSYGLWSDFAEGGPLCVIVSLIDIEYNPEFVEIASYVPVDMNRFLTKNISSPEGFFEQMDAYMYYCGRRVGSHYQNLSSIVHPDAVVAAMNEISSSALSLEEHKILKRLHWWIYNKGWSLRNSPNYASASIDVN